MNYVNEVLLKGDQLWCATTGGMAILNINEGTFTKLNNVNGLGGNYLFSLAIDSAGSFWLGAQNGTLTKHSPEENSWRVYNFIDRDGSRLRIKDIAADGEQLWIGTNKAVSLFLIYKYGGEIKETYRRLGEHMEGEEEVNSVHLKGDRIWVGAMGGVATAHKNDPNLMDPSRWISFTKESSPGLDNDSVYCLTDVNGDMIIGTAKGVFIFDPFDSTWQSLGLENRIIKDLKYVNQRLYASTNAGIYTYEDPGWTPFPNSGLLTSYFNSMTVDEAGTFWVGTAGGGVSDLPVDSLVWQNHVIAGPPSNLFHDMEIDEAGNLWCVHGYSGASLFDGADWKFFSSSSVPEIPEKQLKAVEKDHQNNMWFSSWGAGVVKYDQDATWIRYNEKNSPLKGIADIDSYVVVNDIAVDEAGNRWFPNWEALDSTRIVCSPVQQETSWVVFYERDEIRSLLIWSVFARAGHLYICFRDKGLLDYNYNWTVENKKDDRVIHYTPEDHDLSDDAVWCANVDKDGTLWAGTSNGLDKFDPDLERFRAVPLPDPLGPQVNHISVDERNNKWIATSNGLGMINSEGQFVGVFTTFNSKICANNVLRIEIDKKTGDVWVGTDNGLSRFESGIGAPAEKLSQVVPFPNPFIIQNGTELLTFDRLPYQAEVRIFTVAGELIKEIRSGNQWNGKNQAGKLVASGVYLFHIQDPSGKSAVGKIAVIRE